MAEKTNKIPTACLKEQQPTCEKKKIPEIKIQPKNERKKIISEIKAQTKDEKKKTPEIKIQTVKSSNEHADIERTKNRISRNVAINRSFNSSSKLELLRYMNPNYLLNRKRLTFINNFIVFYGFRQQKFGTKSKENEEFSKVKPKKHLEPSNDNTDGTSIVNGGSIKDRLVALKKSGQTDWQKRILKIKPEDHEVSNNSINVRLITSASCFFF